MPYPLNVGYISGPDASSLNEVPNYKILFNSGKITNFYNVIVLHAANINGSYDKPSLYYNTTFTKLFQQNGSGIDAIRNLQKQGIIVLLTYLDNHNSASWSCLKNSAIAKNLANMMVTDVNKFGLDGIDIDDEFAGTCPDSKKYNHLNDIAHYIKSNPQFSGKFLTKAYYLDQEQNYLRNSLDGSWNMTYGDLSSEEVVAQLDDYSKTVPNLHSLAIGVNISKISQ